MCKIKLTFAFCIKKHVESLHKGIDALQSQEIPYFRKE